MSVISAFCPFTVTLVRVRMEPVGITLKVTSSPRLTIFVLGPLPRSSISTTTVLVSGS
jgi:hypothetical protein